MPFRGGGRGLFWLGVGIFFPALERGNCWRELMVPVAGSASAVPAAPAR